MTWGWMIAKWQWDEATKPGQFRRCPSKGHLGRETKEEKKNEKDRVFSFLRKTEGERENIGELRLGWEEVEWEEKWRKSRGRLFHKAGTVW